MGSHGPIRLSKGGRLIPRQSYLIVASWAGFPELDIPYLQRKKFHGLLRNNKVLIRLLFLTKIDVTKLQLELPTDPGTVWRWFADDLDPLSRNPKVHAPVRPLIPSPLFDANSATSVDSHCDHDLDLAFGLFEPKFDILQEFSSWYRPRYFANQTWPVLEFSA